MSWILGPCSAESEEQVLQSARVVAPYLRNGYFRAGVWKPRTRPDAFEGMGERAFEWLQKAKKESGVRILTEVAQPEHAELALRYDVDAVWIGARTTVNPFYVEAIAEALRGTKVPVFVKNPVNPDIGLWIGAFERLEKKGLVAGGAVHRGFSGYGRSFYRNPPHWEIPIDLKRQMPELPLYCDPSHISGDRDRVKDVAQRAIDLDMDGLMVEVHPDPERARSDADQQVSPKGLEDLNQNLAFRQGNPPDPVTRDRLEDLRAMIDEIDHRIVQELASRMDIAERIGEHKKEKEIRILQLDRWERILQDRKALGEALGLSPEFLQEFLDAVHKGSIKRQMGIMYEGDKKEEKGQDTASSE
ncbi:MAG: chorismate mutase [Flavobacteriales bacterium]